ncbi:unnamed protein product [Phytophthora fragariaefolia]|uniref:Unnamed protein product n=1 Tax=Phytophthora fragariaefolia TaxID=1490495 RepID=A0A9W6XXN2_9STRA|nr:unnamed protein product [Phytophthora fragariaefolia]
MYAVGTEAREQRRPPAIPDRSPGSYEIVGGAISYVHGNHTNELYPSGFLKYHWVDDHINVYANIVASCSNIDRSLRYTMVMMLGLEAINDKKFTSWNTCQRVLGLEFDTVNEIVSMRGSKIDKDRRIVAEAYAANDLTRKAYRSQMGSLRHEATCIRVVDLSSSVFVLVKASYRFQHASISDDMKQDLLWRWSILHTPQLNGVSLGYFNTLRPPDVVIGMDASDFGLCALDSSVKEALTYQLSAYELGLISMFKNGDNNGFDNNCRELLTCGFAVNTWGSRWSASTSQYRRPRYLVSYLRAHSVVDSTYDQYSIALSKWFVWTSRRGIPAWLSGVPLTDQVQHISGFILHGFQFRFGSGAQSTVNPS